MNAPEVLQRLFYVDITFEAELTLMRQP